MITRGWQRGTRSRGQAQLMKAIAATEIIRKTNNLLIYKVFLIQIGAGFVLEPSLSREITTKILQSTAPRLVYNTQSSIQNAVWGILSDVSNLMLKNKGSSTALT